MLLFGLILLDALILISAIESLSTHNIILTEMILSIALYCIHLNESFFCDKFIAIDNSFTTDYSIFYI